MPRYTPDYAQRSRDTDSQATGSTASSSQSQSQRRLVSPVSSQPHSGGSGASSAASSSLRPGGGPGGPGGGIPGGPGSRGVVNGSKRYSGASGSGSVSSYQSNKPYALAPADMLPLTHAAEVDDFLHDPRMKEKSPLTWSTRGFLNVMTLAILALALLMLFAGYPILSGVGILGEKNIGRGLNGTGQVPDIPLPSLIDIDTPSNAYTWTNQEGTVYELVFSDEFEQPARTFHEGDDPFWTGVNLWYGGTFDHEWYDSEQLVTENGSLKITFEEADPDTNHGLYFKSGMLQSWNKTCMQGGYLEFSIMLPGSANAQGFWPGAWTQGNLGRPGYLGTTDGMWPYSYTGCDTGILPNQTFLDGSGPDEAINSNARYAARGQLSKLPGMRASSCTCPGEPHPGPNNNVARSAPEIDVLEAQVSPRGNPTYGEASQSWQVAPFDAEYAWGNGSTQATIYQDLTHFNDYTGGPYQEAVSALSRIPTAGYELADNPRFVTFAVEWEPTVPGTAGFIRWYVDDQPTWRVNPLATPASRIMDIGQRIVPSEPMAIILNLGMATGFEPPIFNNYMKFPAHMRVDYVRGYQKNGKKNPKVSCDPSDYPTAAYINKFADLYNNPNITTYSPTYPWTKNRKAGGC